MTLLNMSEITKWLFDKARRENKDAIVAETKFGFVMPNEDGVNIAYIRHEDKYYKGPLMPWQNPIDFQNMNVGRVETHVAIVLVHESIPVKL